MFDQFGDSLNSLTESLVGEEDEERNMDAPEVEGPQLPRASVSMSSRRDRQTRQRRLNKFIMKVIKATFEEDLQDQIYCKNGAGDSRSAMLTDVDEVEDNKILPTPGWEGLKGRTLTSAAEINFSPEWIFQRFLNKVMQRLFGRERAWYEVSVDEDNITGVGLMLVVILSATIISPLLFPFLYGAAFLGLVLALPLLIKEEDFSYNVLFEYIKSMVGCLWYCWLGCFLWIYIAVADLDCTMEVKCEGISFHLSWVHLFLVPLSVMFAGFRFTHSMCDSACDSICGAAQRHLGDRHYRFKNAQESVLRALSNFEDMFSFFPTFVAELSEKPVAGMPTEGKIQVLLIIISLSIAATPTVWMVGRYEEPLLQAAPLNLILLATGTAAFAIEFTRVSILLNDVVQRFSWAVDELLIFSFAIARRDMKSTPAFHAEFCKTVRRQDEFRTRMSKFFAENLSSSFQCLGTIGDRFQRPMPHVDWSRPELQGLARECGNLHRHRVVFNLLVKDGVLLFRRMNEWLRFDILNERTGLELFISTAILFVVGMALCAIVVYFKYNHYTALTLFAAAAGFPPVFFIVRALNLCVKANEYLFKWQHKILFGWKDAVVTHERLFGDQTAVAWVWDQKEQCPRELHVQALDEGEDAQDTDVVNEANRDWRREIAEMLDITRERVDILQDRQKILGFAVTSEVRTRFVLSLASVLAPLGATALRQVKILISGHQF